jgi:hypothetical protein
MSNEKIFEVTRRLVLDDNCLVKAKTKAEAIEKAQNDDFANKEDLPEDYFHVDTGWDGGQVVRIGKSYAKELIKEKKHDN